MHTFSWCRLRKQQQKSSENDHRCRRHPLTVPLRVCDLLHIHVCHHIKHVTRPRDTDLFRGSDDASRAYRKLRSWYVFTLRAARLRTSRERVCVGDNDLMVFPDAWPRIAVDDQQSQTQTTAASIAGDKIRRSRTRNPVCSNRLRAHETPNKMITYYYYSIRRIVRRKQLLRIAVRWRWLQSMPALH